MKPGARTAAVLTTLTGAFAALTLAFLTTLWGRPVELRAIPLVEPQFTNTATARVALAELLRNKADLSDFDCYVCHEKDKPPPLRFDEKHNLIVPEEHKEIVMAHGRHNRNNLCYNCHNESNLELFQTRDGRELKLENSTPLCGSCHGPTYRDWEAGAHGRMSGFWNRQLGPVERKDCVACHNPHSPKFPPRHPAPGPHPLRGTTRPEELIERSH
jgi:hypothetical protein